MRRRALHKTYRKRLRSALSWTWQAWDRRYDPFVRKVARQRWRDVFRGRWA